MTPTNFNTILLTTVVRFKSIYLLLLMFIVSISTYANINPGYDYNDGPYISIYNDSLHLVWIQHGTKMDSNIAINEAGIFDKPNLPKVDLSNLSIEPESIARIDNVSKIAAVSDIHGQFGTFIHLLQKQGIIDEERHWAYDDGHLVIVGDIFDRGDMVTETLWFVFFLEKEAKKAGGDVHFLLGNHELMVMHGDIRYVNPKYRYTSGATSMMYPVLFNDKTVLGQWLRSKNISTIINDIAFVHGGFSKEVLERMESINKINEVFKNEILTAPDINFDSTSVTSLLYFDNGPLWYRGYAQPENFDTNQAEELLNLLNVKSIVVGHTSMPEIKPLYNNKIFLIDSSMKFGDQGELLIIKDKHFYRGKYDGEVEELSPKGKKSLFETIYDLEGDLKIRIDTDAGDLIGGKLKEEYQEGNFTASYNGDVIFQGPMQIRTRGNMRKQVCRLPPCKIKLDKVQLSEAGFNKNDKLKLVFPCNKFGRNEDGLLKEYMVYKLYDVIDTLSIHVKLLNFDIYENDDLKYELIGFLIEDEEEYTDRTKTKVIESGVLRSESFERDSYLKMVFFQYMILNTDWAIPNKHNLEMIVTEARTIHAIPYDFDYAGMVDQEYAIPFDKLPIKTVRDPYFRCSKVIEKEVKQMQEFYNTKEVELRAIIENSPLLKEGIKKDMLRDIDDFYKRLNDKKRWKNQFIVPR